MSISEKVREVDRGSGDSGLAKSKEPLSRHSFRAFSLRALWLTGLLRGNPIIYYIYPLW